MPTRIQSVYEILDRITDAFFAVDIDWNFVYVNEKATQLLFRSRSDLVGKNVWDEFPEAMNLSFYEQYHKAIREQTPVIFDAYFSPLKTWFAVRAFPSPKGLTVYFRDITKEKLELTKKEQHYESLFDQNPDAVYSFDLAGNYTSVNSAMEQLLGYKEEEYLQQSFVPLVYKDELEKTMQNYQAAVNGTTQRYETRVVHKDGSLIDLDVTNMPIIAEDQVIGVYGIAKDITSKKKSEAALKVKTQQLESFIENNVDAILIFNMDGKVIEANRAFEHIFGWPKQEVLHTKLYKLPTIPSDMVSDVKALEEKVKRGQHVIGEETVRLRKDGVRLNVMISVSPILDANGTMDGWSVTLRDITEWKKSQEMLKNTEKLSIAGQLAAGIAHEIRNPITAIKGFMQLMNWGSKEYEGYFSIIHAEIERIEEILSELLILARPQVSKLERKNIRVLLDQVITLLHTQAILNNVEIATEFQSGPLHIQCDENQLKQVFINYIKNAIEAMPKGGKLVIQKRRLDQERLSIRFIDEGVGMSEEVLTKLGQPFYTTKEKGTGLGYMISKRIIENHCGEVTVKSELNKGTIIDITLPVNTMIEGL